VDVEKEATTRGYDFTRGALRRTCCRVFALSSGELGIVLFLVMMIVVAGRLPAWGESLGSFFHRQRVGKAEANPAERADEPTRD
jgi:hypothetical protein